MKFPVTMTRAERPTVLADLGPTQHTFDSLACAGDFSDDAIVEDEEKTYCGKAEIKLWNETTNEKYRTKRNPLELAVAGNDSVLRVTISGEFAGNPLPLCYHFEIKEGKISTL